MYPKIYLKKGKEEFLMRKHPWIFSGALKEHDPSLDNQIVYVCTHNGNIVATGYYQNNNIAVKIFDFSKQIIDDAYWEQKIRNAFLYRKKMNIISSSTNAYRLIFAEADEIPGLILDNYNGHFVMQAHTKFIYHQKPNIIKAVKNIFQESFVSLYDKSDDAGQHENLDIPIDAIIQENGLSFYVNWKEGQKTGFFLDQRDNRRLLMQYSKDKTVLNTFAYSGGFSVYAAANGAKLVHSVDSSQKAIEWCNLNMKLNGFEKCHESFTADVFDFFKDVPENFYDIIVLDPPAFAKNIHHKHIAVQAYKRLNELALKKIKPNGFLFTFSCSGVIDKALFYNTVIAACFESRRKIKILEYLHLPIDHPVIPNFPEGEYLKGMVLYVE